MNESYAQFTAATANDDAASIEELPDRLRAFLLLPGLDGEPLPPLGSFSAFFMPMLLLPPHERQGKVLMILELLALIIGLILPIPHDIIMSELLPVAEPYYVGSENVTGAYIKGWDVMPTVDDGIRALGAVVAVTGYTAGMQTVVLAFWLVGVGQLKIAYTRTHTYGTRHSSCVRKRVMNLLFPPQKACMGCGCCPLHLC